MMLAGLKNKEFRKSSKWIQSRLVGKEYTHVKFINGYGKDKPYFISEYKGFEVSSIDYVAVYDSKPIMVESGDFIINIGKITETNVERNQENNNH